MFARSRIEKDGNGWKIRKNAQRKRETEKERDRE